MNQLGAVIGYCLPTEHVQEQSVARLSVLYNLEYRHSWDAVGADEPLGQRSWSEVDCGHLGYLALEHPYDSSLERMFHLAL